MLWWKGWLETRFRLLIGLGLAGFSLVSAHSRQVKTLDDVKIVVASSAVLAGVVAMMLAGAGIITQPAYQPRRGLHGSTYFTLSLPVSRLRLLAVRAALGWLEMAGAMAAICCSLWILFPALRSAATPAELLEQAVALVACASGLYSITVLLSSFLDELWRTYASAFSFTALWWLANHTSLPASANIFRAMAEDSPLVAHTMPWLTMAFSLELAAILFFAALKVVQTREY